MSYKHPCVDSNKDPRMAYGSMVLMSFCNPSPSGLLPLLELVKLRNVRSRRHPTKNAVAFALQYTLSCKFASHEIRTTAHNGKRTSPRWLCKWKPSVISFLALTRLTGATEQNIVCAVKRDRSWSRRSHPKGDVEAILWPRTNCLWGMCRFCHIQQLLWTLEIVRTWLAGQPWKQMGLF